MRKQLTHGSTFSGIGAPEVAAEMLGIQNAFHCEINPFGRRVLDYWFPKAESYEDIAKTDFRKWRGHIDILTGGFPCQPFSYAGKRRGAEDDRYLWPQMLRCIDEIRPAWFIGENVGGITTMVFPGETTQMGGQADLFGARDNITRTEQPYVLDEICRNLESIGYSVQPLIIPACAVGAPHRRDRIFIIAHNERDGGSATGVVSNAGRAGLEKPRTEQPTEGTPRDGQVSAGPLADTEHHGLQHSTNRRAETEECRAQGRGGQDSHPERIQPIKADGGRGTTPDTDDIRSERQLDNERGDFEQLPQQRASGETSPRFDAGILSGTTDNEARGVGNNSAGQQSGREPFGESGQPRQEQPRGGSGEDDNRPTTDSLGQGLERQDQSAHPEALGQHLRRDPAGCGGQDSAREWRTPTIQLIPEERWRSFPTVSPVCRGDDGLSEILDLDTISASRWRTETLKAYGNAIVVQVMYNIFKAIKETEENENTRDNGENR